VKRIRPATVTFGVMAIVLGLVAAYIVRQSLEPVPVVEAPPAHKPPPPAPELTPVVFALHMIPKHTQLTAADVFVRMLPKETAGIDGTFRGANLVEGRITRESIAAGRPLRRDHLLGLDEALPDLADRLPIGHRAVTISVQGADTGGKRLKEGDTIDLALTVEGTHPDLGEVLTRTLMRNVLIVDAAATAPQPRNTTATSRLPDRNSAITVAVTPADANKLIVAQRTGTLHATLVSAADAGADIAAEAEPVTRRQLLGLKEVPPARKFTVEKWTGNRVHILEMSDDRIRESRQVSTIRDEAPVSRPAPSPDDVTPRIPSGIEPPQFPVSFEQTTTK
jgi:pilus assembly protein CpaB